MQLTFENMIHHNSIMLEDPFIWFCICFAIGHIIVFFHEIGHMLCASFVGTKTSELWFGRLLLPGCFSVSNIRIRLGIFPGGRCIYDIADFTAAQPFKRAFMSAGGWLIELFLWAAAKTFILVTNTNSTSVFIVYFFLTLKIILGITPITSDGRRLLMYLYFGLRQAWRKT